MSRSKKSKPKGLTPEQIAKANRDSIDYQMQVNPPQKFEDVFANSNQMMSGMMGNAMPIMQGLVDMGQAQMNSNPAMSAFGGPQQPQGMPNLNDIFAQMQPQQPEQMPPMEQPPQQQPNPYNLTPQQMAAIQQRGRGPGRGIV